MSGPRPSRKRGFTLMTDPSREPAEPGADRPAARPDEPAPLAVVLRALESRRPERRRAAVLALARRGGAVTEYADRLIAALRDPDADVRGATVRVLRRLKPDDPSVLDALAAVFGGLQRDELRDASAVLYPHPRYAAAVVARLAADAGGDDLTAAGTAQATIRRLGAVGPAVRHLVATLADPGGRDPVDAARALCRLGRRAHRAIPALLAALSPSAGPVLREFVVDALAEVGRDRPPVREALYAALRDDAPRVRVAAAVALCRSPGTAADGVRVLVDTMNTGAAGWELVQYNLRPAAGRLGDQTPELTSALVRGLRSPAAADRARYAGLLGKLGKSGMRSAEAGAALVAAAADGDPEVRRQTVYALARVEPFTAAAAAAVAALTDDPVADVRAEAGFSADRLTRAKAYPYPLPLSCEYTSPAPRAPARRGTVPRRAARGPAGIARMDGVAGLIPALQDFYRIGAAHLGTDDGEFSIRAVAGRLDVSVPTVRRRLTEVADFFRAYFERFGHPPHRGPFRAAADADELAADGDKIIERSARRRPRICEPVGRWAWELTRDFLAGVSALPGATPDG